MTGARKLTPAQIEAIVMAREDGASAASLARAYGVSRGVISWHCLIAGVVVAAQLVHYGDRGPPVARRGGFAVRRFTAADDALIQRLALAGAGHSAIGRALTPPRRPNSIRGRLCTLARRDAIAELREAAE